MHSLIYGYDPFIVHFFTGSGFDERRYAKIGTGVPGSPSTNSTTVEHFALNSVTFEFIGGISQPWPWSDITIELYQQGGANSVPLGEFGKPSLNPAPTQWTNYTSFIDSHPLTNILLQPSCEYFVSLSVPYNYPPRFGMVFAVSGEYITSTDWRMGATITHVGLDWTEFLKFAVGATAILRTNSPPQVPTEPVSNVALSASRVGANIVLSWPTNMAPSQLYQTTSCESGAWVAVPAQPATINDHFVVTLPLFSSGRFFRLQGQ